MDAFDAPLGHLYYGDGKGNVIRVGLQMATPAAPGLSGQMNNGTINFKLTAPTNANSIFGYEVFYKQKGSDSDYTKLSTKTNSVSATGLNASATYVAYAKAINGAGPGDSCSPIAVLPIDSNVYGVRSSGGSNPNMTPIDAAVGLANGVNGAPNDFDHKGPWAKMTKVSDNMGNTFVKIPKLYIKKTKSGSGDSAVYTWEVSLTPFPDAYLPECFKNHQTGAELPYVLVGAYDASDNGSGGLASTSGSQPLVNTNINDFRTKARSLGTGYQLIDIHVWDVIQTLMTIEFATANIAGKFGINNNASQFGNAAQPNGELDGYSGSSNSNGANGIMNYRGIENAVTNVWQWTDGVNWNNNQIWVCNDPSEYQSDLFAAPYQMVSYQISNGGWVSELGYDPSHPEVSQGIGFNGSSSSYFCAYAGLGNPAWSLGGAWYYPNYIGPFGGCSNYSSITDSSIGSRLVKKPL